ncbi:predicted MFS family arabinose efflux permease [Rhizobium subbaraonis]|uniref:Predicted MFS family arabinose efflux permease n=1 Tax=Rhizobium subbaraonis TaxID=908946 RepID=A0A285UCK1_9HYPH|nr:MFS transporter [Rhizobium subbaraonis]SOC39620.1 predicted MFS family arabinose efflux permease [Rhizobium subbaraonis]
MTVAVEGLERELSAARRNVFLLAAAQAILASAGPIVFSVGGLAGYELLGEDKSLATAPLTGFNIGVALGAVLVAILARALGRTYGFISGAVLGACGGLLAAIALFRSEFWLMAAGFLLVGISAGFAQKIRFAAADASPSFYKPRAISWILAGGVISAILGPQLVILTKDLFEPVLFAGAFVAIGPLFLSTIVLFLLLRLPDVSAAKSAASAPARPLGEIVLSQRFLTGMVCGIASYALMTFMMTGAPLAMVIGCGFSPELATLGIQWHVLAMFAPSFFTGMLIQRFGTEKVVAAGLLTLMACAAIAHAGIELWNFWGALILLGIGWNFGFIGSTAIVASSYRPHEADKVQGFHDIVLFGTVAFASFFSGKVFNAYGWQTINLVFWPVTGISLFLVLILLYRRRAQAR